MAIQRGAFHRKSKVASAIPDSSLADIAFLLLIFFMVSTVFRKETPREIERPDAGATEKVDEKRKDILHVWVERDGTIYINDQVVPMDGVDELVRPLYEESEERLVVAIRSDREVPYSAINQLTEELRDAGALRVNFATEFARRLAGGSR